MQLDFIDSTEYAHQPMTKGQLLYLGTQQVAYLKVGVVNGERAFVIYGADGTPLDVVDAMETAVELVLQNGLNFVTIH
jgi:hypothetical protein